MIIFIFWSYLLLAIFFALVIFLLIPCSLGKTICILIIMFIIWNIFSIDTWDCWEDWLIIIFKISLGHKLINFYLTIFTMVVGLHFNRYKISATCKCFYWGNALWYLKLETIISQFWPYGISYILNNYTYKFS